MTFNLPKRTHLVHKPVELRNLSAKQRNGVNIHDGKEWFWQNKYDGCNMIVVVQGNKGYAFSRTGEPVPSCKHIADELAKLPYNYVYFGEAYSDQHIHSEINGAFRKQQPAPWLDFVVFDGVPLECFIEGHCPVPYSSRLSELTDRFFVFKPARCRTPHTFNPERLESTLSLIDSLRERIPYELDGFVAKRKDGLWTAGAGKGGEQIKVKDHLSLDLKCVALIEGKGKYAGMIGALIVEYKGKRITVGGGKMTDKERAFWFKPGHRSNVEGCIIEVHALAESTHGDLREARFQRVRHDKTQPEA